MSESALEALLKRSSHRGRLPCGTSCFDDFAAGRFGKKNSDKHRDESLPRLKKFAERLTEGPRVLIVPPLPGEEGFEVPSDYLLKIYRALITQKMSPIRRAFMMVEEDAARGVFESTGVASHAQSAEATEKWIKEVFARMTEPERGKGYSAALAVIERRRNEILREYEFFLSQMSEAVRREDVNGAFAAAVRLEHVSRASEKWIKERRTSSEEHTREERSSPIRDVMRRTASRRGWAAIVLELSGSARSN